MPHAAPSTKTSPSSSKAFQREFFGDGGKSFIVRSDAVNDRPLQLPEEGKLVHDVETVATGPKGSRGQNGEPGLKPALAEKSEHFVKEARFSRRRLHHADLSTHGHAHVEARRRGSIAGGRGEAPPRLLGIR